MAVPDFQALMLPLLKLASDSEEHRFRDAVDALAVQLDLSDSDLRELIPSGTQPLLMNRLGWAGTYLKKAVLLESKKRGYFNITERGLKVLSENPTEINVPFLRQFPEFVEWQRPKEKASITEDVGKDQSGTPEEVIGISFEIESGSGKRTSGYLKGKYTAIL